MAQKRRYRDEAWLQGPARTAFYHGRAESGVFRPSIHTYLTTDRFAAVQCALGGSLVGYLYTFEINLDAIAVKTYRDNWIYDHEEGEDAPLGVDLAEVLHESIRKHTMSEASCLILTKRVLAATRPMGRSRVFRWCAVQRNRRCRGGGPFFDWVDADDAHEEETDVTIRAEKCRAKHKLDGRSPDEINRLHALPLLRGSPDRWPDGPYRE